MLRATADDRSAFAELVNRHEHALRRYCASLLGRQGGAEDAAQQCFLDVWRTRSRYRSQHQFRSFLFTVARNRCHSIGRWRALRRFVGLDDEAGTIGSRAGDMQEIQESKESRRLVRLALDKLKPQFREALVLRFVEDMAYQEVAEVVGINASTARSRVHYGLKALANALPPEVMTWKE